MGIVNIVCKKKKNNKKNPAVADDGQDDVMMMKHDIAFVTAFECNLPVGLDQNFCIGPMQ